MQMKPKTAFDTTMKRVDRLLRLYDLLHNTRERGTRKDWAKGFKKLMHWPQGETIHRVDGKNAILVLRQKSGVTPDEFRHDELSELLRAALVTSVSAFDRYCHDLLLLRLMPEVRRAEKNWPADLKKVAVPLPVVKKALDHAKVRKGRGGKKRTRPMTIVKNVLQDQFHRNLTLQKPDDVARALSMVGVKHIWNDCVSTMGTSAEEMKNRLGTISKRRDHIVHEGDIKRVRRGGKVRLNEVNNDQVKDDVDWLRRLVNAIDQTSFS
jgi:hypothetical protein